MSLGPWQPAVLANESLSSWMCRLLTASGAAPETLVWRISGGRPIWDRDIDRSANNRFLSDVSKATDIEIASLRQSTLKGSYNGTLFTRDISDRYVPWILPLGVFGRNRIRKGQLFCPDCLSRQPIHYTLQWRLSFLLTCPIHHVLLHERCGRCSSPWVPHKAAFKYRTMGRCHVCGWHLRNNQIVNAEPLRFEELCLHAINSSGTFNFNGKEITALSFFQSIPYAVRKIGRTDVKKYRARLVKDGHAIVGQPFRLEYLNIANRRIVLTSFQTFLNDWPKGVNDVIGKLRDAPEHVREFFGLSPIVRNVKVSIPNGFDTKITRYEFESFCQRVEVGSAKPFIKLVIALIYCGNFNFHQLASVLNNSNEISQSGLTVTFKDVELSVTPGLMMWINACMKNLEDEKITNSIKPKSLSGRFNQVMEKHKLQGMTYRDLGQAGLVHRTTRSHRPGKEFVYAYSANRKPVDGGSLNAFIDQLLDPK